MASNPKKYPLNGAYSFKSSNSYSPAYQNQYQPNQSIKNLNNYEKHKHIGFDNQLSEMLPKNLYQNNFPFHPYAQPQFLNSNYMYQNQPSMYFYNQMMNPQFNVLPGQNQFNQKNQFGSQNFYNQNNNFQQVSRIINQTSSYNQSSFNEDKSEQKRPIQQKKKEINKVEKKTKKKRNEQEIDSLIKDLQAMNVSHSSDSNFEYAHLFKKIDESIVLSEKCENEEEIVFSGENDKLESDLNENFENENKNFYSKYDDKPLEKDKRAFNCSEDIVALSIKFFDKITKDKNVFTKEEEIEIVNKIYTHAVPLMKRTNAIGVFKKIGSNLPDYSLKFLECFIKYSNLQFYCKNENYNICIQLFISISARQSFQKDLFERFDPYIENLCFHHIGVYVIQKLYQLLMGEPKEKLSLFIETNFDSLVYDHRAIGVVFPYITDIIRSNKTKSIKFIKKKIEPAALSLVSSKFGSLIIIKLFNVFNKRTCEGIVEYLIEKMTQHIGKKHFMKLIHMILWSKYSNYRVSVLYKFY